MNDNALKTILAPLESRRLLASMLAALALAGAVTACSTSSRATAEAVDATKSAPASLELNGVTKWVVPKPMMAHINGLEKAVQDFEQASGRGHTGLAKEIQGHLGGLVTNCTMEGKAHDELHKWLMPFLAATTEYAEATSPGVQQEKLKELKGALQTFHAYFE